MLERKRLMSYESGLGTGGICSTRTQDLWKLEIAMDHGLEKRLDGRKVIIGRTHLMSWYVPRPVHDWDVADSSTTSPV
jgi:hypothetical protein